MRKILVFVGALLAAQPLNAATLANSGAPLAPGKPAGVAPAQTYHPLPAYTIVVLFGAVLAATIGTQGSSTPPNTAASGTSYCCGG